MKIKSKTAPAYFQLTSEYKTMKVLVTTLFARLWPRSKKKYSFLVDIYDIIEENIQNVRKESHFCQEEFRLDFKNMALGVFSTKIWERQIT